MNLDGSKPKLSIGLPVFNGEKYLKEALDSILNQTFSDFELIISDNASTDQTEQICREYAAKDGRIRYYRNEKNIGAPKNFNRVFELSSSEYFKWAPHDDVLAPTLLQKCVNVLDNDPAVVLCYSITGRIDEHGTLVGTYNQGLLTRIDSEKPHERFGDLLGLLHAVCPLLGVGRSTAFARTPLQGNYVAADRPLLAEISLMGRIHEIPECLFFLREHSGSYSSTYYGNNRPKSTDDFQKEMAFWSKDSGTSFPHWKVCLEYFRSVNRVPLKWSEKLLCYDQIFRWIKKEGYNFFWMDMKRFLVLHSELASKLIPSFSLNLQRIVVPIMRKINH